MCIIGQPVEFLLLQDADKAGPFPRHVQMAQEVVFGVLFGEEVEGAPGPAQIGRGGGDGGGGG